MNCLWITIGILAAVLTASQIHYILYRRQVRDICRQLSFMLGHDTNKRLQTSLSSHELLTLVQQVNDMCDAHRSREVELMNKDRRMKEALANVSHDIRTPLTSLKGYFQLLTKDAKPPVWENACPGHPRQDYVQVINGRIDELSELLEELFTYTKLQNKDYELEMKEENVTELILGTLFSFYEECKIRGVEPKLDVTDSPFLYCCNASAVRRIISNLIRNALLHGNGRLRLCYAIHDGSACFSCANTVTSPENIDISQIFERFYKADAARSHQSSGLGLPIAMELTKRMDGEITAKMDGEWFEVTFRLGCIL